MLDPEYLERVSEGGEAIAERLHNDIIKRIVDGIAIRLDRGDNYILTARDKWMIETLEAAGFVREDIEKEIARYTSLMQQEIAEAMEDAGVRSMEYDSAVYEAAGLSPEPLERSPHLIRLMQRTYEATVGEWINFTRTTADTCQQAFVQACDTAYTQVASGAIGYAQAYVEAIDQIVNDGAGVKVRYPSGHEDTIETATLRCIRTGVSQATAQITNARMDEMGWDIILVSSHLGARATAKEDFTNHYWWQGKFYSKSGKDTRFPPYMVCNEGHVQGIHGANCRHHHGPGDGKFNPYEEYDSEENRKEYELQQKQRAMERRVRASKKDCMAFREAVEKATTPEGRAAAEAKYQKKAALLQRRNQDYNQFCEENDLKKLNERLAVAQWDRSQAAKARVAARAHSKELQGKQLARASDAFYIVPPLKGDAIKAQSIYKELQKSEVGKHAYELILDKNIPVEINYTNDVEPGTRGYTLGGSIFIYAQNTRTVQLTAETIIHEAAHIELSTKKRTQWEEAYCFAQEAKHKKKQLTFADLKRIIKAVKTLYPEYPWR